MSATGTAVYFLGVGQPLETRQYPLPEKLDPRAVLVRTRIATVCGSDMYSWRGRRPFPTPSVLGHEGVGVIERMGSSIERDAAGHELAVGDRVTWTMMATCGQCVFCRVHGLPRKCLTLFKYGHSVSDVPPYFLGTFGEYVYLMPGTALFRLPDDMPDEIASPLMCAAATVAGGLQHVGVSAGDTVVVQGAGMLGLYASVFAKALGAAQVIVIDVLESRLNTAGRFGADHLINARHMETDQLIASVRGHTGGLGADLVVEVAGKGSVIEQGVGMLRTGGRYLVQGAVYPEESFTLDAHDLVTKCLTVVGLHNYDARHLWMALNLVHRLQGQYPFLELAGPRFPLTAEGVTSALLALEQRQGIRPIVAVDS